MSSSSPLKRLMAAPRLLLVWIALLIALAGVWLPVHAAVTLASFAAEGRDGRVLITWSTATEINSSGFFVLKSTEQAGEYERIGDFIPSTGDQLVGADYEYEDQDVTNGITYYYRLEAIDTSNNSQLFGPISAIPGVATPTPTITNTPDPSVSPTITNTPGPSATPTQTPTITGTPAQAATSTPAPTQSPVPEAIDTDAPTATLTASATLIPVPALTLTYPSPLDTPTATSSPSPGMTDSPDANSGSSSQSSLLRIGLMTSIVLLWVLLGGWLYIFLYRGKL